MNRRLAALAAATVSVLVLASGVAYAFLHTPSYESTASVVLTPTSAASKDLPTVLDSFTAAGTVGTYVELLDAPDNLTRAGSPPITLGVHAVADSRVITVTATGPEAAVQPGLRAVLVAARAGQTRLGDAWEMSPLAAPSAPLPSGPGTPMLLAISIILALLAGAATLIGLGRLGGMRSRAADQEPPVAPISHLATSGPDRDDGADAAVRHAAPGRS